MLQVRRRGEAAVLHLGHTSLGQHTVEKLHLLFKDHGLVSRISRAPAAPTAPTAPTRPPRLYSRVGRIEPLPSIGLKFDATFAA